MQQQALYVGYQRLAVSNVTANVGHMVWPPERGVRLGEVGDLHNGGLRQRSSLSKLGVRFETESDSPQPQVSYTSQSTATVCVGANLRIEHALRAQGKAIKQSDMFVVFEMQGWRRTRISNVAEVEEQVLSLGEKWHRSWCLVDQVWEATSGSVIVGAGSEAEIELALGVNGGVLDNIGMLGSAHANLSVIKKQGHVFSAVAFKNLTPMFTAMKLSRWRPNLKSIATGQFDDSMQLVHVEFEELLRAWDADS